MPLCRVCVVAAELQLIRKRRSRGNGTESGYHRQRREKSSA